VIFAQMCLLLFLCVLLVPVLRGLVCSLALAGGLVSWCPRGCYALVCSSRCDVSASRFRSLWLCACPAIESVAL